jgi:hypothetical protein
MSENVEKPVCGIVMPISTIDDCSESHWIDVREIVTEAIEEAGFRAGLVSNADDVGIIQKTIIQNLYDNPIVVCDVSGKNPNVMFELGMRLAFDKPTVIIKDEKTAYSFDTAVIEHIEYPRDLRFARIVGFKNKLKEKIQATHKSALLDPSFSTFLKHFGKFTVAKLDEKEVPGQQFIMEQLSNIATAIRRIESGNSQNRNMDYPRCAHSTRSSAVIDICLRGWSDERISNILARAGENSELDGARISEVEAGHKHLLADAAPGSKLAEVARTSRGSGARFKHALSNQVDEKLPKP